ncbi:hypothetical protein [Cohnella thailandensis]|uniref:Uncharacterized protein n=1 Tax=Cohnella thailandensis TaxID=557557 RepID=A0A841SWH6_9BACL|nr:hypothetical protein [Cohnella thailandensis]MBB6634976.1 hypothetical protein [Cohnella thailandensis]MBP1975801.1 hypothetical protein [Cohnella thailandensis]
MDAWIAVKARVPLRLVGRLLLLFIFSLLLAACGQRDDKTPASSGPESSSTANVDPSPSVKTIEAAQVPEEDDSVRAIGEHPDGRLLVRPVTTATVAPLGAPSCYGLETYLDWEGAYEAVWEPADSGVKSTVLAFPSDFFIIQPDETPVAMKSLSVGETDLYVYVPRYTDCHGLETYLFGVSKGEAFPVPFEMEESRVLTNLSQMPGRPPEFNEDELTVWGGWGAGDDTVNEYRFRYDEAKRVMVLQSTEQVEP